MEKLWLKRAMSADPIEGLAMDMEDLQRDTEDINDSREGGVSIVNIGRVQGQGHCLQGGSRGRGIFLRSQVQGRIQRQIPVQLRFCKDILLHWDY